MAFSYFPHTEDDIRTMLERIGVGSLEELYSDVPQDVIYRKEYELPDAMSEHEVRQYFDGLASQNRRMTCLCGLGAYDHYCPAVIPYIISRAEFLTAYTPYQPEVSQGTLRYIFEYQSMITELTGMDCANASMYDGATAAAEAVMMAMASTKKKTRVLLSEGLLPQVTSVVETYAKFNGISLSYVPCLDGSTSYGALLAELAVGDVAGVLVPGINKYGIIEDLTGFADAVHAQKGLLIMYSDPSSLAVIKTPGEWGADIVCGDGQSLGVPLCFGGPYVGFLACRKDYLRKLPGRIVGATRDVDGKRAYVLTLQAREQHIRREKATSNICSNQSLMALYVTVYLSLMGPEGLKRVNDLSYGGAHYLHDRLLETGLFEEAFDKPFLKEFTLKSVVPAPILQEVLCNEGIFACVEVEDSLVNFCVTEKHSKEDLDRVIDILGEFVISNIVSDISSASSDIPSASSDLPSASSDITSASSVISSERSESRNLLPKEDQQ
ncbi:MAG: aminomethyl-transferring glycine dehydrogenase subunit GcvPA [Bacteroidales bacterium]|nr:aminomethyl-transferring glycine dehydrogenase subunit GcvPA [Bacteroidales bacterium]